MRHAPRLGRTRFAASRSPRLGALKAALLAGVVACMCAPGQAAAQEQPFGQGFGQGLGQQSQTFSPSGQGSPRESQAFAPSNSATDTLPPFGRNALRPKPVPPDDGLGERDAYIEADTMVDDRGSQTVTAHGHVEARTQGRTVRADQLIYNRRTGSAHASGNVVLVNADGTVQYAEDIELDDKLRAGLATSFAARLQQNVTIAAGAAVRRTETVQQLNSAIFTPCNICQADGTPKEPTWSIQASRIIQDRDHNVIYYRNAIIRIKGVPILYAPLFWTPDPTAERRSGLLIPRIDFTKRRGFSYEQPYYWAISRYNDLVISPQINTRVSPLLNLRYRQRFYSGFLDIRAGYTREQNFTNKIFYDNATSRSYVLGTGEFNIDKHWIWGFGLERVTDPTFFRRYGIPEVFVDRGPFPTDTDRLISQLYTRRQDQQSFFSVAALSFQSIRAGGQNPETGAIFGESSRFFPTVAPLIEARYAPAATVFGGRLRAQFSAVSLNRNDVATSIIDPNSLVLPAGPLQSPGDISRLAPGAATLSWKDSRRATAQVDWRRAFTVGPGVRVEPFALGRGDLYAISQSSAKGGADDFIPRALGTVGTDISWPLYRSFPSGSLIIEPIAQFAVSPLVKPSSRIPNEDSVSFTFDESNLFSTNRFSGFDLYEGGARLNAGVRANATFSNERSASLLVGRSFRTEEDPAFTQQTGLRGTASDWIVTARATPIRGFSVFTRSRLDADTLDIRRQEVGVDADRGWIRGGGRYVYNETGLVTTANGPTTVGLVETLDINGEIRFLKNWGLGLNATRDLRGDVWPRAQASLFYQDECIRIDVIYTHDEYVGRIDTSDSIGIRLTLATIGDTTPRRANQGGR